MGGRPLRLGSPGTSRTFLSEGEEILRERPGRLVRPQVSGKEAPGPPGWRGAAPRLVLLSAVVVKAQFPPRQTRSLAPEPLWAQFVGEPPVLRAAPVHHAGAGGWGSDGDGVWPLLTARATEGAGDPVSHVGKRRAPSSGAAARPTEGVDHKEDEQLCVTVILPRQALPGRGCHSLQDGPPSHTSVQLERLGSKSK